METTEVTRRSNDEYIYLSLLHLGAVMWSSSSKRLMMALQYVDKNKSITDGPVKCLYAELASAQKCTYGVIERSLRYAISRVWMRRHDDCAQLLYHSRSIEHCPSPSEFICLYSAALQRGTIQEWVDSHEISFI